MNAKITLTAAVGLLAASWLIWKTLDHPPSAATAERGDTAASEDEQPEELSGTTRSEVLAERHSGSGGFPASSAQDPAARWALELLLEDGQPAAAARVAIVQDHSVLSLGTTDDSGCWETQLSSDPVDLVVEAREAPLFRTQLRMEGRGGRVTLPSGASLAGQVLIEGRAPEQPVSLELRSQEEGATVHGLPEELWDLSFGRQPLQRQTDHSGMFRFGGLDPDWSGRLRIPRNLVLEGDDAQSPGSSVKVARVRDDLLLRLKWRALLRGRVIGSDGEAVPDARISCRLWGEPNVQTGARAGSDGTFSFPVRGQDVRKLELDAFSADGSQQAQLVLEGDFDTGADLGDIHLRSALTYRVEVREAPGQPVEGALVFTGLHFEVTSQPTDSEGACLLDAPASAERIRVVATGFQIGDFDLPPSAQHPVVVTLQPATRLEVCIRSADGTPAPGFLVTVRAEEDLFEGPGDDMALISIARRPPDWDATEVAQGWSGDRGAGLMFRNDAEGRVIVYGITPGVPFDVEVEGPTGHRWAQQRLRLQEAEQHLLPVALEAPGRMLEGQVLNAEGVPLPRASVSILDTEAENPRVLRSRRLPQGRFEIGPFFTSTIAVFVRHSGHAPQFIPRLSVPAEGMTQEYRLDPGYRVCVTVVNEGGMPLAEVPLRFDLSDWPAASEFMSGEDETNASGQVILEDLPPATLHLIADVSGRRYETSHPTTLDELRITVPVHGSLEVQWDFAMTIPMSHDLRLTPEDGGEAPILVDIGINPYKAEWTVPVAHVLPGSYAVQLEVEDDAGVRHVLTESRSIVVREREVTSVILNAR